MTPEEQRIANAGGGMRARRFGGAVNYAAALATPHTEREAGAGQPAGLKVNDIPPVTQHYDAAPVEAPAPNISTTMPAVPNVRPALPDQTQGTPAATQGQQLVQPRQVTAQTMPARPGVTADPMTDPYAYIEQMYGPRETPEERAARERREYNNQRIANMLGLFTGIGNMLVTSGNRFGRAVESPNFGEAAAKGVMKRELERRKREEGRLEAMQRQQQLDTQREKMKRDAEDRAWNRAYKAKKDEADDRWRRDKDARDAAYRKSKDEADMAFKREQAERQNKLSLGRLAKQKRHNGVMETKGGSTRGSGSRSNYTDVPVPGYDRGVRVSKTSWNAMKKRQMYSELAKEDAKWFEENGWGERDQITGDMHRLDENAMEQAIVQYIHDHPDSEATKRAVQELTRLRDADPDEAGMDASREDDPDSSW